MKKLVQLKNKNNENIDPINKNYDERIKKIEGTLLWSNAHPDGNFDRVDLNLNNSKYNKFTIICKINTSYDIRVAFTVYKLVQNRLFAPGYNDQIQKDYMMVRDVSISDTTISFSECYGYGIGSITEFNSSMNNCLIPLFIIGH